MEALADAELNELDNEDGATPEQAGISRHDMRIAGTIRDQGGDCQASAKSGRRRASHRLLRQASAQAGRNN